MKITDPHDKFFKETFGDVAVAGDFLSNYLPVSVMKYIQIDTLVPQKGSFIDESLKETFSDLLFKADIAGQEGYICLLFEHKSYPDKGIALQVLRYMMDIWEDKLNQEMGRLPIVIPLVIYHGSQNWYISSSLGGILNGYDELPEELKVYVPNFDYLLYNLTGYSDADIKGMAQTRIGMTLLRDIFMPDTKKFLDSFVQAMSYLHELEDKQTGIEYFETMIRYIMNGNPNLRKRDGKEILQEIEENYPKGSEFAMTLADIWREEGKEKGLKEGLKEGLEKGLKEGWRKENLKHCQTQLSYYYRIS